MRWYRAPAKLNLDLSVLGRRLDGYHDIQSLVAFADVSDWLGFSPGGKFEIVVDGPGARDVGPQEENLVARAAHALAARVPDLNLGKFHLRKHLPVAAGLGGGSSDAAACIRSLVEANGLSLSDDRVRAAARDVGSDVPVCLCACARIMTGVGDRLDAPVRLPPLFAVLVNPRKALATRDVFRALGIDRGAATGSGRDPRFVGDRSQSAILARLESGGNDLEAAAQKLLPTIGDILETLRRLPGARFARMSGSGATCFAILEGPRAAKQAQERLKAERPEWWTAATALH